MDNALHLRIFPVDAQVHTNLAGGLPLTAKQVAVQIDLHEHFLGHKSLGNAGRGRPQLRSLTRQLMLPSLEATKPFSYIRRPTSRI